MWQETPPQFWSKFQVWEWLQQTFDVHQLDATCIPFQNFDIDGGQLCTMGLQDFTRAAGGMGQILYHSLTELKWNGICYRKHIYTTGVCKSCKVINTRYTSHCVNELFSPVDIKTEIDELPCMLHPFKEESCFYDCTNTDLSDIKAPYQALMGQSTSTPVTQGKDSKNQAKLNMDKGVPEVKRKHNRPQEGQFKKHNPRGTHLWEFIRDILLNPERNPDLIKWEDRTEGIFRFLKSEAVAQLWGKKKNNSSMTYEKLSRAMRYYYKREILERVDGRRLVYKFGRNARGWRESDK
ncbi:EHF factor, partial [Polyodon spathula]|nr:EHF factor [Polyodon spathula]